MSRKENDLVQEYLASKKIVGDVLLQSIDPLMDKLRIVIADYVLALRKQLLSNDELVPITKAAKIAGLYHGTLREWIDKELLCSFIVSNTIHVSLSEVMMVKERVYSPRSPKTKTSP